LRSATTEQVGPGSAIREIYPVMGAGPPKLARVQRGNSLHPVPMRLSLATGAGRQAIGSRASCSRVVWQGDRQTKPQSTNAQGTCFVSTCAPAARGGRQGWASLSRFISRRKRPCSSTMAEPRQPRRKTTSRRPLLHFDCRALCGNGPAPAHDRNSVFPTPCR